MSEVSTGKAVSPELQAMRQEIYNKRAARKARIKSLEERVADLAAQKERKNAQAQALRTEARQLQSRIDLALTEIQALRTVKDVIPTSVE